jgi:Ca2+-binding RTX toxin-like protein
MPSIIPALPARPTSTPATLPIQILENTTYTNPAGTVFYGHNLDFVFESVGSQYGHVVNNGTIWNYVENSQSTVNYITRFNHIRGVDNTGLIVLEMNPLSTIRAVAFDETGQINNSGQIYVIGGQNGATVINGFLEALNNSGIIAAQSTGGARGFVMVNSTRVFNLAGGQILAEGSTAVAVYVGRGAHPAATGDVERIENAGLIEAAHTSVDGYSIGIQVDGSSSEVHYITNSGTIRAQYAIYGGGFAATVAQGPKQQVTNTATGLIDGIVHLDAGADQLTNDGNIIGFVDMGEDNDIFSNNGTLNGTADLGFGNDILNGGNGTEKVSGGKGDDVMNGGGGRDLLLGGFGVDTINGGAGNDGLFGEWGNDILRTLGGDYVDGGDGNDRVELGDYSFEAVKGGAGFDALRFATGTRSFDLTAVLATGRVSGFEELDLNGGKRLIVQQSNIDNLVGATGTLRITGQASDTIDLVGTWLKGANVTIGGAVYESYSLKGRTVLISDASTVTIAASAAAAGALDAVATGTAALRPGAASGLDYSGSTFQVQGYEFNGPLTVDVGETWVTFSQAPTITTYDSNAIFTNNGTIISDNSVTDRAFGIYLYNGDRLINNGLISTYNSGTNNIDRPDRSWGVATGSFVVVENHGTIEIRSINGNATAVSSQATFINGNIISAISDRGLAIGVETGAGSDGTNAQRFFNTGSIYASGARHDVFGSLGVPLPPSPNNYVAAIGVRIEYGTLTNAGTIVAELGANAAADMRAYGVFVWSTSAAQGVVNSGRIAGTTAIFYAPNGGDPMGVFTVTNNGTIDGAVQLGTNNDIFNGNAGTTNGVVFGLAGNDTMTGGAGIDNFDGGDGNDILNGDGGNDIIKGGAGNDRMAGGAGNDSFFVDSLSDLVFEAVGGGTDTVNAAINHYLHSNVENLTLDAAAGGIFGVGNALANTILGNAAQNLLLAGAGNDIVRGGGARDAIFGEDGDDQLFGDAGVDYIVGGAGDDKINGGDDSDEVFGGDGNDILYGGASFSTDILVGGAGNDILYANSGLGDYDLIDGGSGDDIYYVDTPADLTFEAVGGGTDTVYADIAGAGFYLYANTENLVLQGNTPFGVGNELDNRLTGNAIGNYLLGGAGNDRLNGMAGNDVLFGEAGADTFIFSAGSGGDVIGDFARGSDKIDLAAYGFANFAALQANFSQVGGNGAINLGGGNFIVLNGVTMSQLTAADFILTSAAPKAAQPAFPELISVGDTISSDTGQPGAGYDSGSGFEGWGLADRLSSIDQFGEYSLAAICCSSHDNLNNHNELTMISDFSL